MNGKTNAWRAYLLFYPAFCWRSPFCFVQYLYSWLKLGYRPSFGHVSIGFVYDGLSANELLSDFSFKQSIIYTISHNCVTRSSFVLELAECNEIVALPGEYELADFDGEMANLPELAWWQIDYAKKVLGQPTELIWCTDFAVRLAKLDLPEGLLPDELYNAVA